MPFRPAFECLWCGRPHQTRSPDDLEGWAGLCPDCVGRAGDNGFLRFRLHAAIEERARAASVGVSAGSTPVGVASAPPEPDLDAEMKAYYAARAPEYDDVYLHRGSASIGPVLDLWFDRELDELTGWLDAVPFQGEIVELAAGTGWWSPLLAQKGELSIYDVNPEPLEIARERLLAHGLRAHIHVRDAWQEPDRQVDGLFCGFWLSHVRRDRLDDFAAIAARWLKPGGVFAFVDERPPQDDEASAAAGSADGISERRLDDGRTYRIPKVFYAPDEIREALERAGFRDVTSRETERFFQLGVATR